MQVNIALLTVTDTRTIDTDKSGSILVKKIKEQNHKLVDRKIVKDEKNKIKKILLNWIKKKEIDVIITTGGTGLTGRDVTPEATLAIIDREVPGIAEAMRNRTMDITPFAALSRSVAGVRQDTLIINMPGSPKAVQECLEVLMPVIPHALDLLKDPPISHES